MRTRFAAWCLVLVALALGCAAQLTLNRLDNAHAQTEIIRTKLVSVLRPAPSGQGGPWFVSTEQDGAVKKVTTGVATPTAALNQARDDQAAILSAGGFQAQRIAISTDAATP